MSQMVEEFQCPGCVNGPYPECYEEDNNYCPGSHRCKKHVPGTFMFRIGKLVIGLPKGFDRMGESGFDVRLWDTPEKYHGWDHLNVPVWALERDGYLFVRTYAPRINKVWVDVVKGGTLAMVSQAINVGEFYDEID